MKIIKPSKLNGTITMQASKSAMHRAFICAALSGGRSELENITFSDDIKATLDALSDMGFCNYFTNEKKVIIEGNQNKPTKRDIYCNESGSTLRMILPLGLDGQERRFICKGRLIDRPMTPYQNLFEENGILFKKEKDYWILKGELPAGNFETDGNISSQFISGLLFKLPLLNGNSEIEIKPPIESLPYIKLTRFYQKVFGVNSYWDNNTILVKGNQNYRACNFSLEGDYSHAAFFAVGAALSGSVILKGLNADSRQGDKEIFNILNIMGAKVVNNTDYVKVSKDELSPVETDVSQIPDLTPVLAVLSCGVKGTTKIYNAGRLRLKESDRLNAITMELEKLGADIIEYEDSLVIHGTGSLNGGEVESHNDHRIAMALTIASCIAKDEIKINGWQSVNKSAPDFFKQFIALGGKIIE